MEKPGVDHYASIEGARALLSLWVVVSHLLQQSSTSSMLPCFLSALPLGEIPVRVFMIMSGFVITHLITQKREPYHAYIVRRFFRLAPLMWATTGFILLYNSFVTFGVFRWNYDLTPQYLAGYAAMLHGVFPEQILADSARSINPPTWSISLEWQFYLIAPLLLWKRTWPFAIVAAVAALLLTKTNLETWYGLTFDPAFLPTSMMYFLVGIGSYFLSRHVNEMKIPFWGVITAAIAAFAITGQDIAFGVWGALFCALLSRNFLRTILETRVLVWLGSISYSIYLVHGLILIPVRKQLLDKMWGIEAGTWTYLAIVSAIVIPATILVAWITYLLIERPGQRFGSFLGRWLSGLGKNQRKKEAEPAAAARAPAE